MSKNWKATSKGSYKDPRNYAGVVIVLMYAFAFYPPLVFAFSLRREIRNCKGLWVLSASYRNAGIYCSPWHIPPILHLPGNGMALSTPEESLSLYAFAQERPSVTPLLRVRRLKAEEKHLKMLLSPRFSESLRVKITAKMISRLRKSLG